MVGNLSLYINDKLVDFSTDPQVLYTYQQTDVTNPTAVKNSFSKTITIDGTPNNNDIFGHYWNVERYLLNGGEGGAYFNSSKKAPFQIFVGSDLYEEGYCKLDNINKVGGVYKYEITLYGGLGDFFWNLSASDDGDAKKLSDLTFMPEGGQDEFDFTANIDAVNTAWAYLVEGSIHISKEMPNGSTSILCQHTTAYLRISTLTRLSSTPLAPPSRSQRRTPTTRNGTA